MWRTLRGVLAFGLAVSGLTVYVVIARSAWFKGHIVAPALWHNQRGRSPLVWYQDPAGQTWKPEKVLIFAYGRSGSSLTGDIIHHSPDVYYFFEPLHLPPPKDPNDKTGQHQEVLQAIFHCNFTVRSLQDINRFSMERSYEPRALHRCFKNQSGSSKRTIQNQKCIKDAEQVCKSYRVREVKVIRLTMNEVFDLMTLNPDLAVIFLLRDPRASMWSRMNVFGAPSMKTLPSTAKRICQSMRTDLNASQKLFSLHPERFRFLRYEDLAQSPVRVSQNIYKFLNLKWTQDIELRIRKQVFGRSQGDKSSNSGSNLFKFVPFFQRKDKKAFRRFAYSLTRDNSSLMVAQWKMDIPVNVMRIMQDLCSDVLTLVGYRKFDTLASFGENSGDIRPFKLVEQLPFRGDLNY